MTRFYTEKDVAELLPMGDAVACVERALRLLAEDQAVNLPRQRIRVDKLLLHVLPAGSAELGYVGLKAYTTGPSGARFYFLQFDAKSGELVAMMQADRLGQIRTGAASGVATKFMAREDATRVGIYGTGWQARAQLQAIAEVRPIVSMVAYGRDAARREKFCSEMTEELGVPVRPVETPEEVPQDADIVVTATNAREPVLRGAWLKPGQHVNAIGSNALHRIEIDEEAVTRMSFIAADAIDQAKIECGDLAAVVEAGKLSWDGVHEIADVVGGKVTARRGPDDITLFESQGLAIEDVAVAKHVYEAGSAKGMGTVLEI
ncbi:MAG: ornithine cyclodeaminase family protein [Acidobacteria bacterium]|nr:MAG: ornithine cyclodeaminase family protein [Acidobacteriota bacterium]